MVLWGLALLGSSLHGANPSHPSTSSIPIGSIDPRVEGYRFRYTLYPPGGFSVKKSKATVFPDSQNRKASPLIGEDGRFTELGAWYFALASDPAAFAQWWNGYWSDDKVWQPHQTPVFNGTTASNQGHRIIAWAGQFAKMIERDERIAPAVKAALMTDEWKEAVEETIGRTIDGRGLLSHGANISDMAQCFHFIRTKFSAIRLRAGPDLHSLARPGARPHAAHRAVDHQSRGSISRPAQIAITWRPSGAPEGGIESDIRHREKWAGTLGRRALLGLERQAVAAWHMGRALDPQFAFQVFSRARPRQPEFDLPHMESIAEEQKAIGRAMILLCSRRLWLDWSEKQRQNLVLGRRWPADRR